MSTGQLDLIPQIDTSRATARRAAMAAANARADVGSQRAADKADREAPGWCGAACEALRGFARAQGGVFTIELARLALRHQVPDPRDGRAWGVVTRMAQRNGFIERVPGQYFPAASSNGSPKPVYRKGALA